MLPYMSYSLYIRQFLSVGGNGTVSMYSGSLSLLEVMCFLMSSLHWCCRDRGFPKSQSRVCVLLLMHLNVFLVSGSKLGHNFERRMTHSVCHKSQATLAVSPESLLTCDTGGRVARSLAGSARLVPQSVPVRTD